MIALVPMFMRRTKVSLMSLSFEPSFIKTSNLGGLVPLHNSSSYGHQEVSQLLIKAGANVNASGEFIK